MPRCPSCHRRLGFGATCPTDGEQAPAAPERDFGPPPTIDGYQVKEPLGRGGASTVWDAAGPDGPVALKVAHAATSYLSRRFQREASALSALPAGAAPALFDQGHYGDGIPYIAIEKLAGQTLTSYLESLSAPPPPDEIIAIASAVLANLEAVHAVGLRHRDIKPDNIFIVAPPPGVETRLIDFGLTSAKQTSKDASVASIAGTIEYIAPESLTGGRADHRADLYSFGIVLYELMTLRVPFAGDRAFIERGHVALRPPRPSSFAAVPEKLEEIVRGCLAKAPGRRPSLRQIARGLEGTIGAPASLQSSPGATAPTAKSSRQPVVLLVADIDSTEATAELRRRGGVVVRQHGKRHVCAFTGATCDEPAGAALSAGETLLARGIGGALHLADLRVRATGGSPIRVYGVEVEDPASWLPPQAWEGLILTDAFASAIDRSLTTAASKGFWTLAAQPEFESTPTGPMLGRDGLLDAAAEELDTCLSSQTPGLFTVIGAAGLGKSRFAAELAAIAQGNPGVRAVHFRARAGADNQRDLLSSIGAASLAFIKGQDAARHVGELLTAAARIRPTALIIDDAHRLSDQLCDAIEYASLDSPETPLWIAVLANTRLESRRRNWGKRANRHRREELRPLDDDSAMELAAELLKPADYPPAAVLRRLAEWAGGNPFFLVELVRALKRQGLVRERDGAGGFYVTTADFDKLPAIPAGQWLATRLVENLPAELAALVRLCAVLGGRFDRDELAWVQDAAEALGASPSAVDTDVGLAELERLGILRRERGFWTFVQTAVASALAQSLTDDDVRQLRAAAMEFWREGATAGDEAAMLAFAGHAAAAGQASAAADTYLLLGDRARSLHHTVDADQHFSAALGLASDDQRRAVALAGRGEVRYRMQRMAEAIDDLDEAIELAASLGDEQARARWLLAQGTALDWADRYSESTSRVETATEIAERLGDKVLQARCVVSRGRTRWRQERIDEAIDLLDQGAELTAEHGDYEYQVIALLLLPLALIFADRRDEAEVRFSEVIELCESIGDRFHLCAAYGNRMFLWRNSPDRAVDDLRRANQLAREVGQAGAERVTTHNLAEILFWSGDDSESLALAERAYELQRRLMPVPVADDSLLLARIRAGRAEWTDVSERLDWIERNVAEDSLAPSDRLVMRMLALGVASAEGPPDGAGWDALVAEARETLAGEEFLEVLYTRARVARAANENDAFERALSEAGEKLAGCAVWKARFEGLS